MASHSSFVTIGLVYVAHTFIILPLKYEGGSCWTPPPRSAQVPSNCQRPWSHLIHIWGDILSPGSLAKAAQFVQTSMNRKKCYKWVTLLHFLFQEHLRERPWCSFICATCKLIYCLLGHIQKHAIALPSSEMRAATKLAKIKHWDPTQ